MKRWVIVALVLVGGLCFSQGIEEKGAKVGLNIANLRGDDVKGAKSKIGMTVGGFLTYRLKEQIVLQPELLFSMKGGKRDITIGTPTLATPTTTKYTESLNYIEIPVLVKYSLPTQGNIKPSIFAGPSLGILLSAKRKNSTEKDIKDDLKSTDIGLVIGAGIDVPYQAYKLKAELRYTLGLTKISKEKGKEDVKNGAISIMAGCAF